MSAPGGACALCGQLALPTGGVAPNPLLTAERCAHKVCRRCLQSDAKRWQRGRGEKAGEDEAGPAPPLQKRRRNEETSVEVAARNFADAIEAVELSRAKYGTACPCPVCWPDTTAIPPPDDTWLFEEDEASLFAREKRVRAKVFSVYNATRAKFPDTPAYNSYIEHREDIVHELAFGLDDSKKRELQDEVTLWESEHQKEIVECRQQRQADEVETIRDIVSKEGIFYELVNTDARYRTARETMCHSLQRERPELFGEESFGAENQGAPVPGTTGKRYYTLGSNKPQPLSAAADVPYEKLPRRNFTDKAAMLRACGMTKTRIHQRVVQEFWGGLGHCARGL